MNITNDYNSLRREQVIVQQQHREDSSCQSLRFLKKTWLSRQDLKLKAILFICNKVYKDLNMNKAR